MKKQRLDLLLVERGLIETREKAKRTIMAGLVYSEHERLDKPGLKVNPTIPLKVKGNPIPYVGRGGLKLEKALKEFTIKVKDKVMLDIGSSTGGFTDCALQNGAKFVYALDVGYNQLAWKLRNDERVCVMERTNFRYSSLSDFEYGQPNFATIDVSFISLKLILPVLKDILIKNGEVVALVKPQFEAGKDEVGKKGIVKDRTVHEKVLNDIAGFASENGYKLLDMSFSPITGGDGNIEFLFYLINTLEEQALPVDFEQQCIGLIENAHEQLIKNR